MPPTRIIIIIIGAPALAGGAWLLLGAIFFAETSSRSGLQSHAIECWRALDDGRKPAYGCDWSSTTKKIANLRESCRRGAVPRNSLSRYPRSCCQLYKQARLDPNRIAYIPGSRERITNAQHWRLRNYGPERADRELNCNSL